MHSSVGYSWVPDRHIGCLDLNKRIRCENFDLSYKRIGIGNDYNKRIGRIDGSVKRVYLIHLVMYRNQISTMARGDIDEALYKFSYFYLKD